MKTREYAAKLLDQLIQLDKTTSAAYYEMGRILHALFESKLHEVLGYESYTEMINEECSFTASTSHNYRKTYKKLKELHYNKTEALKLMQEVSFTRLSDVLRDMNTKLGVRGVKRRVAALALHQINFQLYDDEVDECHAALKALGATESEEGRLQHSSEAFMQMVRSVNKLKKVS